MPSSPLCIQSRALLLIHVLLRRSERILLQSVEKNVRNKTDDFNQYYSCTAASRNYISIVYTTTNPGCCCCTEITCMCPTGSVIDECEGGAVRHAFSMVTLRTYFFCTRYYVRPRSRSPVGYLPTPEGQNVRRIALSPLAEFGG